jgi:peptidoglycan/LPS O-acetylase OafA/YrhL
MKPHNDKIYVVQTLRGVAALLILVHHWTICVPGFIPSAAWNAFFRTFNVGVPLFFMISGFVMPYAMDKGQYSLATFPRFLAKRMVRLDPPYFLSIIFCLLLAYIATLHPRYTGVPFEVCLRDLALHALYLVPFFGGQWVQGGVFWTLGIEFQYYIIVALMFPLLVSRSLRVFYVSTILFAAASLLPGGLWRFIWPYTTFFCMGMFAFRMVTRQLGHRGYLLGILICSAIAISRFDAHKVVGAVLGSLMIVSLSRRNTGFLWLGSISYSVYLFHLPIAIKVVNYCMRYPWAIRYNWLIVLLGSAGCLLLGWLVYLLVEKPSQRWAASIEYRKHSNENPASTHTVANPGQSDVK